MPLIAEWFPYVLLAVLPIALTYHPVPGARAILFFAFGYFVCTAFYSLGMFTGYESRYHLLVVASATTIALYHSLDMTPHLLVAWLAELFLMGMNASMIMGVGPGLYLHWQITVAVNLLVLLVLIGGWSHGRGRILYARLFDLDLPLGIADSQYRFACSKTSESEEGRQ